MIALLLLSCFSAKKVKTVRVVGAQEGLALCPGISTPLTVRAKQTNGKVRTTDGRGREGLGWGELVVRLDQRNFEDGAVALPADPRESMGKTYALEVFLKDRPEIGFQTTVVPRYDCAFVADFSGSAGSVQDNTGFLDRYGLDGAPGGHGDHGGTATAYVTTTEGPDGQTFLQARVTGSFNQGSQRHAFFLIDPAGGSLRVDVGGGPGGAGERGTDGRDGDDGEEFADGSEGRGDDGGPGGNGGDGGDGGDGGSAVVLMDPSASAYRQQVTVSVRGGAPGPGGEGGVGGDGGDGDPDGDDGYEGRRGRDGRPGRDGPQAEVIVQPVGEQF